MPARSSAMSGTAWALLLTLSVLWGATFFFWKVLVEHLPPISVWASLVSTAVLCTAVAYIVYFRLLALAGATNLLLVTFLLPISALLLGVLCLHEAISPAALTGMALIGCGLAAIGGRLASRLPSYIQL